MSKKCYAFPVPNLELETLHTYARLIKEKLPEIYTGYVEKLSEIDLVKDIPLSFNRGNFLVFDSDIGGLHWGWNPSDYFDEPYIVISLDGNDNREFLGDI